MIIIASFLFSLFMLSDFKIFYDSERIIELTNVDKDVIDKALDDKNILLLCVNYENTPEYDDWLLLNKNIEYLKKHKHVQNIRSVFNEKYTISAGMLPSNLCRLTNYETYLSTLKKIQQYNSNYISSDYQSFLFVVKIKNLENNDDKSNFLEFLKNSISKNDNTVFITGQIKSEIYMQDHVTNELVLFTIISSILCSLFLWFFLRNLLLVFINLISVFISISFSFALSILLFGGVELIMILIPAIVFVIVISDYMHLLNNNFNYINKYKFFRKQILKIGIPVFVTSLTTSIGFLSFTFSEVMPLFRFGIITTITIFFALFIIINLYSFIVDFNLNKNIRDITVFNSIINLIYNIRGYKFVLVSILFIVLSIISIKNFSIDNFITDEINDSSDLYQEISLFDEKFGGIKPVTFIVKNDNVPIHIIDSIEYVITSNGLVIDFNTVKYPSLIRNKSEKNIIKCRMQDLGSVESGLIFNSILQESSQIGIDLEISGVGSLFDRVSNEMTFEVLFGLIIAILIIGLIFVAINKFNWYYFPISLIPNVIPLLASIGILSFFGFYFSLSNAFILAIVFGLIVDDSIHIINSYRYSRNDGLSISKSIKRCHDFTFKAVFKTSIVIVVTLSPLIFSEFKSISQLSYITMISAVLALIFDILILPKLLIRYIR